METVWDDSAKIVLEIPHRGEPVAWLATDEKDFQDKLINGFTGSEEESYFELLHEGVADEAPVNEVTTEQLLDIAGSDLQKFKVFDTLDEARHYALVDRGQGFGQVYQVLNDWDLFIFQISILGKNDLTVYEYFTGNDDVNSTIYSALEDRKDVYDVDFVSTDGNVLAEVPDIDDGVIEDWLDEIDESSKNNPLGPELERMAKMKESEAARCPLGSNLEILSLTQDAFYLRRAAKIVDGLEKE
jgi:hypothetical protein